MIFGNKENKEPKSGVREYVEALGVAVLLALFIRSFFVQAFVIPSESMLNTLLVGDYLLVNKLVYGVRFPYTFKETNPHGNSWWDRHTLVMGDEIIHIGDPEHGEIVVFEFPEDPSKDYIKRVIGVPGDVIEVRDKVVYRNGKRLDEEYKVISNPFRIRGAYFGPITVPEGKYFMMGDNRDNSEDSRFWGFVDRTQIKGRAWVIYWSMNGLRSIRLNRIGSLVHNL